MRLIDADALIELWRGRMFEGDITLIIANAPTIEPEIIRCKDCRYWQEQGLCEKWDYYISNGDFYCGCAEWKEGEADG